jgi:hypothetical protein
MDKLWKKNKLKNRLLIDLHSVDEIILEFVNSENSIDNQIKRTYYTHEFKDNTVKKVNASKEDFENMYKNSGDIYFSELNFKDFIDFIDFEKFEYYLDVITFKLEIDFINIIERKFYKFKFEGQAKFFLLNVVSLLETQILRMQRLKKFYDNSSEYVVVNDMQYSVIICFYECYENINNKIIGNFKLVDYDLSISTQIQNQTIEKYQNFSWFKVGLKFANGEIFDLQDKKYSFKQIAKELFNNEKIANYISESFSNTNTNDKNIFSKKDKLDKIKAHCDENNITIDKRFDERLQTILKQYGTQ